MGLMDSIIGSVAGSVLGGSENGEQGQAMKLIGALVQNSGGVGNLLGKLQGSNLSSAVSSWVGNGENQAVAPEEVHNALGTNLVTEIAQKVGVDPNIASQLLAKYLPNLINKITPNGTAEDAQKFDLSDGLDLGDITALASKFLK